MSKASSMGELNKLHRLVTRSFHTRLEADLEDGIPTDAATLGAAIKFLKDNEVSADPADKDDLQDLRESLKKQAEKRKAGSVLELVKGDLSDDDYNAMTG